MSRKKKSSRLRTDRRRYTEKRLKQLFFNDDFIDSINGSTNDKSKILKRIKIVKGVLK